MPYAWWPGRWPNDRSSCRWNPLTARFERGGCDRVKWAPPPLVAVGEEDRSFLETRMWRPADRVLVGDFGAGQALSDDQYRLIEPMIPRPKPGGRPRTTDMRRLLDGLFYVVRTGCQWRHLPPPPAFPPWRTIYGYMRDFASARVWEALSHHLVLMLRAQGDREPSPTAAIVDTQSVKTPAKGGL